jgi:hypothetical protein
MGEPLRATPNAEVMALAEGVRGRWVAARRGARMYEAVLARREVALGELGPLAADLARFRDDELRHAGALGEAMLDLSVEPPAPSSDVETMARLSALADPRTPLAHVLRVLLETEVADVNAWETLITPARRLGKADLVRRARRAALEDELHIVHIRHWMAELALRGAN